MNSHSKKPASFSMRSSSLTYASHKEPIRRNKVGNNSRIFAKEIKLADGSIVDKNSVLASSRDPFQQVQQSQSKVKDRYRKRITEKDFKASTSPQGADLRSIDLRVERISPDIVQEVVDGEETPMINSTQSRSPKKGPSVLGKHQKLATVISQRETRSLFPIPQGCVSHNESTFGERCKNDEIINRRNCYSQGKTSTLKSR